MIIIVGVSIDIAVNSRLFSKAGEATKELDNAIAQENSNELEIDGITYSSMDEYLSTILEPNWEEILANTTEPHPDQGGTADIGIGTDGKLVNLDLWKYEQFDNTIALRGVDKSGYPYLAAYQGDIIDGKIQGTVPQYIKLDGTSEYLPVTEMSGAFYGCTSLTTAPEIPSSVTELSCTFKECSKLTGTLTINANPTYFYNCLKDVATDESASLVLSGSSSNLTKIYITKSPESNITLD